MHSARKSPFSPILFHWTKFAFPYIDSDRVLSKPRPLPMQCYASASKRPLIDIFKLSSSLQLHRIYDFWSVCAGGSSCHPIPQVRRRVPRSPTLLEALSQPIRHVGSVVCRLGHLVSHLSPYDNGPPGQTHLSMYLSPRECECLVISTDRFSFSLQG
jgi:hypothetical protein